MKYFLPSQENSTSDEQAYLCRLYSQMQFCTPLGKYDKELDFTACLMFGLCCKQNALQVQHILKINKYI